MAVRRASRQIWRSRSGLVEAVLILRLVGYDRELLGSSHCANTRQRIQDLQNGVSCCRLQPGDLGGVTAVAHES
jgi:hypothetical protein